MKETREYDIIVVTGPTASGKTGFAARLAANIGTGKDYDDYIVDGKKIPVHMIDIVEPGYKYNVYEYQKDFLEVYQRMKEDNLTPIVCGGSGMYLDSILRGYSLIKVPVNQALRDRLSGLSLEELAGILKEYKSLHNKTDVDTVKRAVRAIEIEDYYLKNKEDHDRFPSINALILGIRYDRDTRRERISKRLEERLSQGMVEEVEKLLAEGIPADDLIYYGLEYKFITYYLQGDLTYKDMKTRLETAIHQFAKRQMTWFRGMERRGVSIHWLDGHLAMEQKIERALSYMGTK